MGTEPETVKEHNQRAFDRVSKHLVEQGRAAVEVDVHDDHKMCAYRAPDGCKCAIGCLIPDSLYDDRIEGKTFRVYEDVLRKRFQVDVRQADRGVLIALQQAHDRDLNSDGLVWWVPAMQRIARDYGLSTEALDAALAARETSQ